MRTNHKIILLIAYMCIHALVATSQDKTKSTLLTIQIPAHQTDTITTYVFPYKMGNTYHSAIITNLITHKGKVTWELPPFDSIAYLNIGFAGNPYWNQYNYLIEPGDVISIIFQPNEEGKKEPTIQCSGLSIAKFACKKSLDSLNKVTGLKGILYPPLWDTLHFDQFFTLAKQRYTNELQKKLEIIDHWKNKLSKLAYDVMLADQYYMTQSGILKQMSAFEILSKKYADSVVRLHAIQRVFQQHMAKDPWMEKVSHIGRNHSMYYMDYIVHKALRDIKYNHLGKQDAKMYWEWFKRQTPLQFEKAIATFTGYYMNFGLQVLGMGNQLQESRTWMTHPHYAKFVRDAAAKFEIGKPVFPFVLPDTKNTKIDITSFRGKTVVIDFWNTGCLPCMKLAEGLKQVKKEYKEKDKIVFMSISKDADRETWLKSVASGKYTEPDNINVYTDGKGIDHPLIIHYGFFASPRMLIIDPEGKIISTNPPYPLNPKDKTAFIELLNQSIK